jgi:hypothetical protein
VQVLQPDILLVALIEVSYAFAARCDWNNKKVTHSNQVRAVAVEHAHSEKNLTSQISFK